MSGSENLTILSTTTDLPPEIAHCASNYLFAAFYILALAIGAPANLSALIFFIHQERGSQNKNFFNVIYVWIALVDLLISATLPPVIVSFLWNRSPAMFGSAVFCHLWGLLWETLPFLSVYLVGVMSLTRTFVLIKPLIKLKVGSLKVITIVYTVFLLLRSICPISIGAANFQYSYSDVYCYELPSTEWSYKFNSISRSLTLAAPVIPICISCMTSYVIIMINERRQVKPRGSGTGRTSPRAATMTILIFTIAYIVFNIPVFINYLLMTIAGWKGKNGCIDDCYSVTYADHKTLLFYSWNFTYVMCVALNSAINPLIYYWRMNKVKDYVNAKFRNARGISRTGTVFSMATFSKAHRIVQDKNHDDIEL
eukprot:sb/3465876/